MRQLITGLVLAFLILSTHASAQNLDIKTRKISLAQFFKELRRQTGYNVAWNEEEINADQLLEIELYKAPLKEALSSVLETVSIDYSISGKTIVLKRGKKKPVIQTKPAIVISSLEDKPIKLKEVEIVRTGYQEVSRQRATGSFALVDTFLFQRRLEPDVLSRLEGITSGLLFNKNTLKSSNGNLDLSLRGRSTIYANDQPLIILDNFPFKGDYNSLNPNDVATVTILRDAAAAAIWGVRAGNGVIVISTKKGKFQQPLQVLWNSNYTISEKPNLNYSPNSLSSADFIQLETFLFENGKYDALLNDPANIQVLSPVVKLLHQQRTSGLSIENELAALAKNDIRKDYEKYFYRREQRQQHALSLSGGTTKSHHYFSAGYDQSLASLRENDNNRFTLNTQQTFRPVKDLELSLGLNYSRAKVKVDSTISEGLLSGIPPYFQYRDTQGNPSILERNYNSDFTTAALDKGFLNWDYVPLNELGAAPVQKRTEDIRLNAAANYQIIPGLNATIKYQYQHISENTSRLSGLDSYFTRSLINRYSQLGSGKVTGYNVPLGDIFYKLDADAKYTNLRGQLNYQKSWQNHALSAIAGYEVSEFETSGSNALLYGYDPKTENAVPVDTITRFDLYPNGRGTIGTGRNFFGILERIRSSYANLAYTYLGKYTLSGSARIDGSNYFGVKTRQKNVPLWSVGTLWNLDRENFYTLDWLPILRLRASYGFNGNLDRTNTGLTTFKYSILNAPISGLPYAGIISFGNPELKWERIGIANFGLEFGTRAQIITGKLEYYLKNGADILGDKEFPSNTGIKKLRGNYARIRGEGIDLSLASQNLRGELKWQSTFLFSAARDRVTEYGIAEPGNIYYVGTFNGAPVLNRPVYGIYSYKFLGLDQDTGDPVGVLNGEMSKDYTAIVNTTPLSDLEYHGTSRPTMYGGLSNTFVYDRFSLNVSISYKLGYYFRKNTVDYYGMYAFSSIGLLNRDFERRWQQKGDQTIIPSMANYNDEGFRDQFYKNATPNVLRGDHIRLQDISLSYNFAPATWRTLPLKSLQLYAYASNLGLLWKANHAGIDPDVVSSAGDQLSYPSPRSFSLGLKANF